MIGNEGGGPPSKIRRRIVLGAVFLFMVLAAFGTWVPWEGAWLDAFLSHVFSKRFYQALSIHGAKVSRWNKIYFKSIEISDKDGMPRIRSGSGLITFKRFPWPSGPGEKAVVEMNHLNLSPVLYNKTPLVFLNPSGLSSGAGGVNRLKLSLSGTASTITCHVLECQGEDFRLRGGATFVPSTSKLSRMHALLLLRNKLLRNVPETLEPRLIRRSGGWRGLRILYARQTLTAFGAKTPFFRADWR